MTFKISENSRLGDAKQSLDSCNVYSFPKKDIKRDCMFLILWANVESQAHLSARIVKTLDIPL